MSRALVWAALALAGCDLVDSGDDGETDGGEARGSGGSGGTFFVGGGEDEGGGAGGGGFGGQGGQGGQAGTGGRGGGGRPGEDLGSAPDGLLELTCLEAAEHFASCLSCRNALLVEAVWLNDCEGNDSTIEIEEDCEALRKRVGADLCEQLDAFVVLPSVVLVKGAAFNAVKPNGTDWDGNAIINDLIVETIISLVGVQDPTGVFNEVVDVLVEAVAQGFAPPDPYGTGYVNTAGAWTDAIRLTPTHEDTLTPVFEGPPGWYYDVSPEAALSAGFIDSDLLFDDTIGSVVVEPVDLYRAYLKGEEGRDHPVFVGDQGNGSILYLVLSVTPNAGN